MTGTRRLSGPDRQTHQALTVTTANVLFRHAAVALVRKRCLDFKP